MPSDKKRVNLTIPDDVYIRLQAYKSEMGIENDATACLQLIVQQMTAHDNSKAIFNAFRSLTIEQIQQLSNEGLSVVKTAIDKLPEK